MHDIIWNNSRNIIKDKIIKIEDEGGVKNKPLTSRINNKKTEIRKDTKGIFEVCWRYSIEKHKEAIL